MTMAHLLKTVGNRLLKVLTFLVVNLIFMELMLRTFFPVSDMPISTYDPAVGLHLGPNQSGTWVVGNLGEVHGRYFINSDGWNSIHEYTFARSAGTLRVAVIGNSFIEALTIDVDQAFPARLEAILNDDPSCDGYSGIEVYSFGYSGASLAQNLSMMRYAAERYQPDVFILNVAARDFETSINNPYPHFLHYRQNTEGKFEEVPPVPYKPSKVRRVLVNYALPRYIYLNLLLPRLLTLVPAMSDSENNVREQAAVSAAPDDVIGALARHIFAEYRAVAQPTGSHLLLIFDPDLDAVYHGQSPSPLHERYRHLTQSTAEELDLEMIDLTSAFKNAYARVPEPYSYSVDGHWNKRGNEVVAETVATWFIPRICAYTEN